MPRTVLTIQPLDTKAGENVTFVNIDATNDHEYTPSGACAVLIQTAAGEAVTLNVPSIACSHGRVGDLGPFVVGASVLKSFGPFEPSLFGDGSGLIYLDFSAVTGTPKIAIVRT